jgi:TATA-box binding protein (TBP) (component of TFIID and TFIIIB)
MIPTHTGACSSAYTRSKDKSKLVLAKYRFPHSSTVTRPKVSNVKISFKVGIGVCTSLLDHPSAKITSYYVIVREVYVFTFYFKSGVINITKIATFNDIPNAVKKFMELISSNISVQVRVDNSTATGSCQTRIDFNRFKNVLDYDCLLRYNNLVFPGAFFKTPNNKRIILFKSGKYVCLGCRSESEVEETYGHLKETFRAYGNGNIAHQRLSA